MNNFVISLIGATERRNHIINEFQRAEIDFKFFDAINTNQVFEFSKKLKINLSSADLTDGEKACLLSHVSLWNKAIEDNLPYIGIYEDDIFLGNSIQKFFQDDSWISPSMDIIKLEVFSKSALMDLSRMPLCDMRYLRKLKGEHLGAAGYIISKSSAKILLNYIQNMDKVVPVDHILFDIFVVEKILNVYQVCPGLCIQSDRLDSFNFSNLIQSQLEINRRIRLDKQKKMNQNIFFKIRREWRRFLLNSRLLLCRIYFK